MSTPLKIITTVCSYLIVFAFNTTQAQPFADTNATTTKWTTARLLSDSRYQKTTWKGADENLKEPSYQGQPLSKFLRNKKVSVTNELTLDEMFTLKQVITGEEPEIVTYELPISYDIVTNTLGSELTIVMDSNPDEPFENQPELWECDRATNGDCLLAWNTAFERPGRHVMQAIFSAGMEPILEVKGPVKPYFSSNLCQFFPSQSLFNNDGAFLDAYSSELNVIFSIEIKTRSGTHIKTFTGQTTNGVIHVDWNLLDEHGLKYTNNSFDSFFHITLPSSGRSQTLRQPQNKLGTSGN